MKVEYEMKVFQFQKGTIEINVSLVSSNEENRFQFQKGTIEILLKTYWKIPIGWFQFQKGTIEIIWLGAVRWFLG